MYVCMYTCVCVTRPTAPSLRFNRPDLSRLILSVCKKINRSHTHTPTENTTPDTHTHDKNNTPNPQMNTSHKHLTTLEGGAMMVRATSHARVDGRV